MIGNFFTIALSLRNQLNTIAYFALLRENHSLQDRCASARRPVLIDVYNVDDRLRASLKVRGQRLAHDVPFPPQKRDRLPAGDEQRRHRPAARGSRVGNRPCEEGLDHWDRFFIRVADL